MNRDEAAETIDAIKALWQVATPVPEIAETVHLPTAIVVKIIQSGRWPETQPQWHQGDLADQPTCDGVSER